jgi:hypothetical protein
MVSNVKFGALSPTCGLIDCTSSLTQAAAKTRQVAIIAVSSKLSFFIFPPLIILDGF